MIVALGWLLGLVILPVVWWRLHKLIMSGVSTQRLTYSEFGQPGRSSEFVWMCTTLVVFGVEIILVKEFIRAFKHLVT